MLIEVKRHGLNTYRLCVGNLIVLSIPTAGCHWSVDRVAVSVVLKISVCRGGV